MPIVWNKSVKVIKSETAVIPWEVTFLLQLLDARLNKFLENWLRKSVYTIDVIRLYSERKKKFDDYKKVTIVKTAEWVIESLYESLTDMVNKRFIKYHINKWLGWIKTFFTDFDEHFVGKELKDVYYKVWDSQLYDLHDYSDSAK